MKMKTTSLFAIVTLIGTSLTSFAQTQNSFFGLNAGIFNTANFNTGFGIDALSRNSGNSNLALGMFTLQNSIGGFNCAIGNEALINNSEGGFNIALGVRTLINNNLGSNNVAIGYRTLEANQIGNNNTSIGYASLLASTGNNNIALGYYTPRNLITGDNNIFIGSETGINLFNGSNNVILGNRVALERAPSSALVAGNDTNRSIIIADGVGTQRIFIARNGNTGIGLGNNIIPANRLDIKGGVVIGRTYTPDGGSQGEIAPTSGMLVEGRVGIGTVSPNNKVEITHGTNGNSGLRFTNLNSSFNGITVQSENKFLSVNATGDVVLQKVSNAVESNQLSSNTNQMTSNVNGIASSTAIVNSISNIINTSNQLITSVNGVQSTPVNLPAQVSQTLSQSGNTITLSNNGGSFTLPTLTDTDAQSLSLNGTTLSISNGNSVTLPAQVPQTISQSGNTITLSNNGGSFTLPTFTDTNTDAQSLSLTGNTLSISNGNSVILPSYTDIPQTLSQSGNTITLSNNGGSFTLPTFTQVPQTISQSGNTITLSNNGGSFSLPTTSVVAGNNITVTGNGSTATPFLISSIDKSIYADNGTIDQSTTINNNRIVYMNNSNIWFNGSSSESNAKIYIGSNASYPNATGNYKLFVEGGILTEKVKVALRSTANWADYVFEKNYDLMPLKNVEEYINEHKHLPGIDSAEELSKNGLDLAEMQAKHMAKIEELTLYIIEQNKAIEKSNKDILELKRQVNALTSNED
jgi:hypothetical protein